MAILILVNLTLYKTYIHFFFQNVNFFIATFGFHSAQRLIISEGAKEGFETISRYEIYFFLLLTIARENIKKDDTCI